MPPSIMALSSQDHSQDDIDGVTSLNSPYRLYVTNALTAMRLVYAYHFLCKYT